MVIGKWEENRIKEVAEKTIIKQTKKEWNISSFKLLSKGEREVKVKVKVKFIQSPQLTQV